jgi:hypothetical protein
MLHTLISGSRVHSLGANVEVWNRALIDFLNAAKLSVGRVLLSDGERESKSYQWVNCQTW